MAEMGMRERTGRMQAFAEVAALIAQAIREDWTIKELGTRFVEQCAVPTILESRMNTNELLHTIEQIHG